MAALSLSSNWMQLQGMVKKFPSPSFLSNLPPPPPPPQLGPRGTAGRANVRIQTPAKKQSPASLALWAEDCDIPRADVARAYDLPPASLAPTSANTEVGRYISLDCEMVGVGSDRRSALARVSVVNYHGNVILDTFVRPKEKVTDWRTWVSGVSPSCMKSAREFEDVQRQVAELLQGKILVGHALMNDLTALLLSHPKRDIRDTSRHEAFRKLNGGHSPALKMLAKTLLGIEIQGKGHSSVEDARACMLLYRGFRREIEESHNAAFAPRPKPGPRTSTKKKGQKKGKKGKKQPRIRRLD